MGKEVWPHPSHVLKRVAATAQAQLAWSLECSQGAQSSALRKQAPLGVSTVPFALRDGETGHQAQTWWDREARYGLVQRDDNRPGTSQAWSKSVCTNDMPARDMMLEHSIGGLFVEMSWNVQDSPANTAIPLPVPRFRNPSRRESPWPPNKTEHSPVSLEPFMSLGLWTTKLWHFVPTKPRPDLCWVQQFARKWPTSQRVAIHSSCR